MGYFVINVMNLWLMPTNFISIVLTSCKGEVLLFFLNSQLWVIEIQSHFLYGKLKTNQEMKSSMKPQTWTGKHKRSFVIKYFIENDPSSYFSSGHISNIKQVFGFLREIFVYRSILILIKCLSNVKRGNWRVHFMFLLIFKIIEIDSANEMQF